MESKIKVKDHPEYQVDVEFLEDLIEETTNRSKSHKFFVASLKFYESVEEKEVESLTAKQLNWLWELNCVIHDRKEAKSKPVSSSQDVAVLTPEQKEKQHQVADMINGWKNEVDPNAEKNWADFNKDSSKLTIWQKLVRFFSK